jgi:hypothetical protein
VKLCQPARGLLGGARLVGLTRFYNHRSDFGAGRLFVQQEAQRSHERYGSRNRKLFPVAKSGPPDFFHDSIHVGTVLGVDFADQLLAHARGLHRDFDSAPARFFPPEHAQLHPVRGVPPEVHPELSCQLGGIEHGRNGREVRIGRNFQQLTHRLSSSYRRIAGVALP